MTDTATRFFIVWLLISFWTLSATALAQSQLLLTTRDTDNITYHARHKMKVFNNLLNQLTVDDLAPAELDEMIKNSYTPNTISQIFYTSSVIIEDDINPAHTSSRNTQDLSVENYLNNLYLFYSKTKDANTIVFSNLDFSPVKTTGNSVYIVVRFTSVFKGRHVRINKSYLPSERLAEMRAEKVSNKWVVYITRIAFAQPGEGRPQVADTKDLSVKPLSAGKPAMAEVPTIAGPKATFIQADDNYKVIVKFDKSWLQVVQAEKPEVPVGFYKHINNSYVFDSLTRITFDKNSTHFILYKGTGFKLFDLVEPSDMTVTNSATKPELVAKPVQTAVVTKPVAKPAGAHNDVTQTPAKRKAAKKADRPPSKVFTISDPNAVSKPVKL